MRRWDASSLTALAHAWMVRAVEATAVHRPDDHVVVECTEEQQLLDDVGRPEDAVDGRVGQRRDQTLEQRTTVGHGHRVAARADRTSGRVVGGYEEDVAA